MQIFQEYAASVMLDRRLCLVNLKGVNGLLEGMTKDCKQQTGTRSKQVDISPIPSKTLFLLAALLWYSTIDCVL